MRQRRIIRRQMNLETLQPRETFSVDLAFAMGTACSASNSESTTEVTVQPMEDSTPSTNVIAAPQQDLRIPDTPRIVSAPISTTDVADTALSEMVKSYQERVLDLVNTARGSEGLEKLQLDDRLSAAALDHSQDMNKLGFFSHTSPIPEKAEFTSRAERFETNAISENIAWGYRSAEDVVQGWLDSPGHRQNILDPQARFMGVGNEGAYWTQLFR